MNSSRRRGSIELSVNFLVVIIISIILLGFGIQLMAKFMKGADVMRKNVGEQEQDMLKGILSTGSRVALIPSISDAERGGYANFDLGISNELGEQKSFVVKMEIDQRTPSTIKILYIPGPYVIKNNAQHFVPITLKVPKETAHGTYLFYLYVCNFTDAVGDCYRDCPDCRYGLMQKPQINVK